MFTEPKSSEEFIRLFENERALLVYFSNNTCNVCKSLKPKVEQMVSREFPQMKMVSVNSGVLPEISGQYRIYAMPALLIFFEGRESLRKIGNFSINELFHEIKRPYSMVFEG